GRAGRHHRRRSSRIQSRRHRLWRRGPLRCGVVGCGVVEDVAVHFSAWAAWAAWAASQRTSCTFSPPHISFIHIISTPTTFAPSTCTFVPHVRRHGYPSLPHSSPPQCPLLHTTPPPQHPILNIPSTFTKILDFAIARIP